jgi:TonB family protein
MGYRILSPTAGVDLLPYLTTLNSRLVRNFRPRKPKSTGEAGKGVAVIRVQIQKDGSLTDRSVTVFSSSGDQDVDAAALSAVRAAAPFARLPEKYSGAYLKLEVRFYFKNQAPEQKPIIIPVKPLEATLRPEPLSGSGARDANDGGQAAVHVGGGCGPGRHADAHRGFFLPDCAAAPAGALVLDAAYDFLSLVRVTECDQHLIDDDFV